MCKRKLGLEVLIQRERERERERERLERREDKQIDKHTQGETDKSKWTDMYRYRQAGIVIHFLFSSSSFLDITLLVSLYFVLEIFM